MFVLLGLVCIYSDLLIRSGTNGNFIANIGSRRVPRSVHALHTRLCPSGTGSESCFYSQLSMFMKMQDRMFNPMSLRAEIGKRAISKAKEEERPDSRKPNKVAQITEDNLYSVKDLLNADQMKQTPQETTANELKDQLNSKSFHMESPDAFVQRLLDTTMPSSKVQAQHDTDSEGQLNAHLIVNGQPNRKHAVHADESIEEPHSFETAQNDCPPNLPESRCHDNIAYKYYFQILKALSKL